MSNGTTLAWTGTAGFYAQPAGTTMMYNVSRPLMQPGRVQQFRAWKYDSSLPYNPANEIVVGVGLYPTQLLAQEACQDDWDMNAPPTAAPGPSTTDDTMHMSVYDTNADGICDHAALADSVDWINVTNKVDFSTTERWTGRYWIDGRKVYQKTVNGGVVNGGVSSGTATNTQIPHGIVNLGTLVSFQLMCVSGTTIVIFPYCNPNPDTAMGAYVDPTNIITTLGKLQPDYPTSYATLFYTCTDR